MDLAYEGLESLCLSDQSHMLHSVCGASQVHLVSQALCAAQCGLGYMLHEVPTLAQSSTLAPGSVCIKPTDWPHGLESLIGLGWYRHLLQCTPPPMLAPHLSLRVDAWVSACCTPRSQGPRPGLHSPHPPSIEPGNKCTRPGEGRAQGPLRGCCIRECVCLCICICA